MRIRKQRHLPVPLSPPPPPDPSLPPLVQELHHHVMNISTEPIHPHHDALNQSPWDLQTTTLRRQTNGSIWSRSEEEEEEKKEPHKNKNDDSMHHTSPPLRKDPLTIVTEAEAKEEETVNSKRTTVNRRKWSAKTSSGVSPVSSSSSSPHQGGSERWCGGDISFPLKKRRDHGFIEQIDNEKNSVGTKINKKLVIEEEEEEENGDKSPSPNNNKKRRARTSNGAIQEGSRCSRVNGRGWRCSQQTLVGYSLCEHHLGKGRLRSIRNVSKKINASSSSSLSEEHDEQQTLATTKKGKKIGVVKARSLSSLLSITQHAPNSITT